MATSAHFIGRANKAAFAAGPVAAANGFRLNVDIIERYDSRIDENA
jgi:hypothetical protein